MIKVWSVGQIVNSTAAALLSKSCLSMVDLSPKFLFSLPCLALLLCRTFPPALVLHISCLLCSHPSPNPHHEDNIWAFEIWIILFIELECIEFIYCQYSWNMDQYVTQGSQSCPHSASENYQPSKGENESNLLSPNDVLPAIDLGRKSSGCPLTTRHHLASHPFCHHRQVSPLQKTQKHTKADTQTQPHTSENTGHGQEPPPKMFNTSNIITPKPSPK